MTDKADFNGLKGWHPGMIETRVADLTAASYDAKTHSVETVISRGVPVKRFYGTETLRIHPKSVITTRLDSPGIPVLDSHQQASINNVLGRINKIWFDDKALIGRLQFTATPEGRKAEGMVARREIGGVSAGYRVEEWRITDEDGDEFDPEVDRMRMDEEYNFEAVRWELLECSLTGVPADATAAIRKLGEVAWPVATIFGSPHADAVGRMLARQRIARRNQKI
jgi:HK97 family phage prohead protease